MESVYVLCVLGESPTVLSNLLWWLAAVEQRPVAGIEVWATGRGARKLHRLVAGEAWSALQRVTGPMPALHSDAEPSSGYGFRAHPHTLDGLTLDDVRSAEEAAAVSASLHDRVRSLRRELPPAIPLVGCLAGGRKTVSAALQTAFSMQARAADRLVHVVFDATVESALYAADRMPEYAFPDPRWEALSGVAPAEQIVVYDVPFPRLRYLVPRRLSDVLETKAWAEVWPLLEANMGRDARGELTRRGFQSWTYRIVDAGSAEVLFETKLGRRAGALLAAMAEAPDEATASDLVQWLDDHPVGWKPPTEAGADEQTRTAAIRSAGTALRKALQDVPVGLERFTPTASGLAMGPVTADWRLR